MLSKERELRYIPPEQFFDAIAAFDPRYAVTRGVFTDDIPSLLADMEWNHMDQLHRPYIHRTYGSNTRIASGKDFAVSLMRFGRWPFLITVTDVRVEEGVYYQTFVLGGLIGVHIIIRMQGADGTVNLRVEWAIQSHRFLKPLHAVLDRMLYRLNTRLQKEDAAIRGQRFHLRKCGYSFRSDPPDYITSNLTGRHTVYPKLAGDAVIALDAVPMDVNTLCEAGNGSFVLRRRKDDVLIWSAACPHQGGELQKGTFLDDCRLQCPWHGLTFSAACLSADRPSAAMYGFLYRLEGDAIHIRTVESSSQE